MHTIPTDTAQPTQAARIPMEDPLPDKLVSFGGDGEPKSPRTMLQTLIEFEEEFGFEADSYSLGGNVQQVEEKFAEMLGKEAAVFMPTGTLANHLAVRTALRRQAACNRTGAESPVSRQWRLRFSRLSNINLIPLAKDLSLLHSRRTETGGRGFGAGTGSDSGRCADD